MAQRFLLAMLFALASMGFLEARQLCTCTDTKDFGSCVTSQPVDFPGGFPGSAAIVAGTFEGAPVKFLFVADLFEGFTYRYDLAAKNGVLDVSVTPVIFLSPGGSKSTTGLAFNPIDSNLYWAIEGSLVRTGFDLNKIANRITMGTIDLASLKTKLNLPLTPEMGGITYHEERATFWGVDIVNDIYFEFRDNGNLVEGDDGLPVHFRHPLANPYGGGAYGNGISYVHLSGKSYFDLPVGRLTDGGVSQIVRVHAVPGGEGDLAWQIGDPAGVFYNIEPAAGAVSFVSGISYFPSTCNETNHTEILLDIAVAGSGNPSRIIQVSVDDPDSTTVSHFTAEAPANSVHLSWKVSTPYQKLEIQRRLLPSDTAAAVTSFTSPALAPKEYLDRNIADGLYEYIAQVTPPAAGRQLPAVKTEVVVGQGKVLAHAAYPSLETDAGKATDPLAMTFVGSSQEILVLERGTGIARRFGLDLEPKGAIPGPFVNDTKTGGLSSGIAWRPEDDRLIWSLVTPDGSFLVTTNLAGIPGTPSTRARVSMPINLRKVPWIGDIAYDPARKEIWGIDQANMAAFTFDAAGKLTGKSATVQIQAPRTPSGIFGGGIAVVESDASKLVLDLVVGKGADGAGELARMTYSRNGDDLTLPGTETATVALQTILQCLEIGGIAAATENGKKVEIVLGADSGSLYKLQMESGQKGKPFKRGEVNNDGSYNISDPITLLNFLFKSGPQLPCEDAADMNDDELLDLSDAIALFSYLFKQGSNPPPPFLTCGNDFDPPLICGQADCK